MTHKNHQPDRALSVGPGAIIREYKADEAQQWAQRWLAVYAAGERAPGLKQYLWHTFSYEAYPSVCGSDADRCYVEQDGSEIVVLANHRRTAVLTDALPTHCSMADYCVFPPDLAWTMAFTHEDGWLGPYFAKHPDYASLTERAKQQRVARLRKIQETERARQKGWV
ncbi:DUF4275 family protein [Acidovorax sp. Q11]